MIDWSRVAELHEEVGDDALAEVLELFASEVDEGLVRLSAATNPKALAAEFHFLKGAALNLGLDSVAQQCAEGETAALAGNPTDGERAAIARDFPECCRLLRAEWRRRLSVH